MVFSCKLADCCMDCKDAHIDIRNETVWPSGQITPTTVKSTLYCRHMAICHKYLNTVDGDRMILVPLSNFLDDNDGCDDAMMNRYNDEEGDGINE